MKSKTLSMLLAAGLIVPMLGAVTASQLQAQMGDRPEIGPHNRGDRAERLIEELDLTESQVQQIQTIRQENRDDMQALQTNLWSERETMRNLMASTASEAELRTQHETVQSLRREAADQRFENMLAIRAVLTPEQRIELNQLMQQRQEERRGMRRNNRGDREFNRRNLQSDDLL